MDWAHVRRIREWELESVIARIDAGASVLEIGAGSGWQAQVMESRGLSVKAIDVESSSYANQRVWAVETYDGTNIPFPAKSFDVVFSSNVLEHVTHLGDLLSEMRRVLKPGGTAIHLLPTSSWRWWTSVAYYPHVLRLIAGRLGKKPPRPQQRKERSRSGAGLRALLPPRHGEAGTVLTELYYFSRRRWDRLFEEAGWEIETHDTNHLFYTGYLLLGARLGMPAREKLSRLMGSSCHFYQVRPR